MEGKELFLKWIENDATDTDMISFIKFSNNNLGTKFTYKNMSFLTNSFDKITHGIPNRDEMINWLENQDRNIVLKVAENLNGYFLFPIWDDLENEEEECLVQSIEDSNHITLEMIKSAIASSLLPNSGDVKYHPLSLVHNY